MAGIPSEPHAGTVKVEVPPERIVLTVPARGDDEGDPPPEAGITRGLDDDPASAPVAAARPGLSRSDWIKLVASVVLLGVGLAAGVHVAGGFRRESRPTPNLGFGQTTPMTVVQGGERFPDANLEAAVRASLGLDPDASLLDADLDACEELTAPEAGIANLLGIGELRRLRRLDLRGNRITSLRPLLTLPNLQHADLRDNSFLCPAQRLNLARLRENGVDLVTDCAD